MPDSRIYSVYRYLLSTGCIHGISIMDLPAVVSGIEPVPLSVSNISSNKLSSLVSLILQSELVD
jgi:hypothetical protein